MVETEKRGKEILDKEQTEKKMKSELELQHLYQADRDYFLEIDELTADNQNSHEDEGPETTLDASDVELVKRVCENYN